MAKYTNSQLNAIAKRAGYDSYDAMANGALDGDYEYDAKTGNTTFKDGRKINTDSIVRDVTGNSADSYRQKKSSNTSSKGSSSSTQTKVGSAPTQPKTNSNASSGNNTSKTYKKAPTYQTKSGVELSGGTQQEADNFDSIMDTLNWDKDNYDSYVDGILDGDYTAEEYFRNNENFNAQQRKSALGDKYSNADYIADSVDEQVSAIMEQYQLQQQTNTNFFDQYLNSVYGGGMNPYGQNMFGGMYGYQNPFGNSYGGYDVNSLLGLDGNNTPYMPAYGDGTYMYSDQGTQNTGGWTNQEMQLLSNPAQFGQMLLQSANGDNEYIKTLLRRIMGEDNNA